MYQAQESVGRWWEAALGWLDIHPLVSTALGAAVLMLVAYLAEVVAKRRIVAWVGSVVRKTTSGWDDALIEHKVLERFSYLAPAAIVYYGIGAVPGVPLGVESFVQNVTSGFMIAVVVLAFGAFLTAANHIYEHYDVSRSRPIKGYLQVAKIVLYVLGGVLVASRMLGQSPLIFVSGITAMTAVLLLIFRDTILSLVASVQLMSNDMIRVGDWVEMPEYNADGDVVDIALHTVKIKNFDNTITFVPTSKFIDDSFRNWRGMTESGARRIKRCIYVDQATIRFLEDEEIERFKQFVLLREYVESKERTLAEYNASVGVTPEDVNARRLTNIGMLRAYLVQYLRNHPKVHQARTLLVRQLAPTAKGLPLEIYVFTNDTVWANYEGIQSDIFDHILALVPEFGLRVFQDPSGADFRGAEPQVLQRLRKGAG